MKRKFHITTFFILTLTVIIGTLALSHQVIG